jgi:2-dehydropantoate 2-reductase
MRICIYGAGVIGGLLASALSRAGHHVSVIARGPHLAAIKANGLIIIKPPDLTTVRIPATSDPRELGPQDMVIVATKTPALPDVAAGIGPLLGPDTLVGFALNGMFWFYGDGFTPGGRKLDTTRLDPDGALHRAIGAERSFGIICYAGGEIRKPGIIDARNSDGRFIAGAALFGSAERIMRAIRSLGVKDVAVEAVPDVRVPMWPKYVSVVANHVGAALTGGSIRENWAVPEMRDLMIGLMGEAIALAAAHGFTNLGFDLEKLRRNVPTTPHKPSMLQDLERGRSLEIDCTYMILQDLTRQAGLKTPVLDTVLPLLVQRAQIAGCYPRSASKPAASAA